jgi:hypothetical protein
LAEHRVRVSIYLGLPACGVPRATAQAPVSEEPSGLSQWLAAGRARAREAASAVVLGVLLVEAASVNPAVRGSLPFEAPSAVRAFIAYTRTFQSWSMFAPDVPTEDVRLIIDVTLADGTHVDPQTGEALVTLDAPEKADSGTAVLGARLLLVSFLGALALSGVLGVAIVWRTVRARRVGPVLADEDARVLERSLALKRKAAAPLVCPQCGERYPEETVFCGLDGARLERVN